ncbi:hypothetical protein [Paenibacillus popilliae]|uniref:Acetylglutamate semialdehyde dehydrogenase n=1 Tax=Paenibacillus popilliae ATCC 14706 TaxID=1212764 RepID=M9LKX7_PAEPP|nr:hypothetical protein [Paenibacillus popilliae]GAC40751.1 acetylglutamate semialdehyde dehydrogenase [Paenibacillus popilliae ATCC 14706]
MNNVGLTPKEYLLEVLKNEEDMFREITRLDGKEKAEYEELLEQLEEVHKRENQQHYDTHQKGKALETIVSFLLGKSVIFEIHENIRNSTNEIDQLLCLSYKGKKFKDFLPFSGDLFLSECKNYNKKIDVTWVGKFFSLLTTSHTKIGFLFSYYGLTGKKWNNAVGLTKKLFLLKERLEDRTYIIDLNISDFRLIQQGHSLLELIDSKMKGLKTDTSFEVFLQLKHPVLEEREKTN